MIREYLFDGTVLHTKSYYTLIRGRRQYLDKLPEKTPLVTSSTFEFEAYMHPPLHLVPVTWERYNYSTKDVVTTFEKMDASYVWQISLMLLGGKYEPEAASAGVRSTFQSHFTFLFISRKTVFEVFMATQKHIVEKNTKSVLCRERPDHKPMLPKVFVDNSLFDKMRLMVPERHPSFAWTVEYPYFHTFKDIKMVPVSFDADHDLVYMTRIILKTVYDSIPYKSKPCLITLPCIVDIMGGNLNSEQYVLTDEACFFSRKQSSGFVSLGIPQKRKKRMNANKKENLPRPVKKRKQ